MCVFPKRATQLTPSICQCPSDRQSRSFCPTRGKQPLRGTSFPCSLGVPPFPCRGRPALESRDVLRVGLFPRANGGRIVSLFQRKHQPPVCRSCGSTIYRSKRTGFVEDFLRHVLFLSPYRCVGCDDRQFRFRPAHHSIAGTRHAV